jgi:phosphohistidine phosphatase
MDLILWRHAEAHDEAPEGDLARALTPRGHKQAERMAHWLNQRLPHRLRVLASPAVRAQQTAAALERKFRTVDALGPDSDVQALLQAARWPDGSEPVLVVGHQPTLGHAVAWLLGGVGDASWSIRKGGVWWLRRRPERDGSAQTLLMAAISPELL